MKSEEARNRVQPYAFRVWKRWPPFEMANGFILDLSLTDSSALTGTRMSFVVRPMARESVKGLRKGEQLAIMQ